MKRTGAAPNLVCVIGIREGTGGAIARRFAPDGHIACATHRGVEQLVPLPLPIRDAGVLTDRFACNTQHEEVMIALVKQKKRSATVSARL